MKMTAEKEQPGKVDADLDVDVDMDMDLSAENPPSKTITDEDEYPGTWSLAAIMVAVYLAMFLVALVSKDILSYL
jgi:hypothetical protein